MRRRVLRAKVDCEVLHLVLRRVAYKRGARERERGGEIARSAVRERERG
jgi:hypothetical protein